MAWRFPAGLVLPHQCRKRPAARERREDIPFLIEQFIRRFNRDETAVSASQRCVLSDVPWGEYPPAGKLHRALHGLLPRQYDRGHDLPDEVRTSGNAVGSLALPAASMQEAVSLSERQAIQAALAQCGGNRRLAAEKLGLHPTTFYRKLKRLGLRVDLPDGRHKRD